MCLNQFLYVATLNTSKSYISGFLYWFYKVRVIITRFGYLYVYVGCVDFLVSFNVDTGSGVRDSRTFTSVDDIKKESDELSVNWIDGDRLDVTVRAVDIFNKTLDENVTVFRDSTPPVIENLWLTKGDRLNISVHSLEEFDQMT